MVAPVVQGIDLWKRMSGQRPWRPLPTCSLCAAMPFGWSMELRQSN